MIRRVLLGACLAITLPAHAAVAPTDPDTETMHAIFDEYWEVDMRESPTWASMLGDRRYNQAWPDLSADGFERRQRANRQALTDLREVERNNLSLAEQVNYDLFERRYNDRLAEFPFGAHLMPISQRGGIQTLDELGNRLRMTTVQDYDDWLVRLSKLGDYMDETIALMQQGIERGVVPPTITMQRVPAQIAKQVVELPTDSLIYKPFTNLPASLSDTDRARIQGEAKKVIAEVVIPAYARLQTFFNDTYLPATRDSIGASDLPDGKAFYEQRTRRFTTTEMTPDEIHNLGLEEVARNREAMMAIKEEVNFEGTLAEFFDFLRTDPQFYFATSDELFEGYLAMSKRLDPMLVTLFGKLPRMPYGLKKIPDAVAPDTTTAYYNRPAADGSRAGYYYVNLYKPETRPKWEMAVLSVHEAVPGHHLQIALQQELEGLPNFRRYSGFTAFVEGWGLYSERLGYDMGLYEDPYSRFGQITYDQWRAVRLVVDTGMHYKGWSRERAIEFFKENAPRQELDIINEIDRYISWPGQALAYKIGQLKILELRARAERELGDDFDIRGFHDTVLGQGAVPLNVLEKVVDAWIASEKA